MSFTVSQEKRETSLALYLGFTTDRVNLLKPIGCVMHEQVEHSTIVRSAHTVFMWFVFV
jgi:hypothetical protein